MPTGVYQHKALSEKHRKNISLSLKGRTLPWFLGKPRSEETKRKISESSKGKKLSEEHKKKLSIAFKGKKKSQEHRRKLSISMMGRESPRKGKTHTQDAIKKIKAARARQVIVHSPETCRKIREANINNPNRKFKDTGIELKIEAELQRRNIVYQKQVPLCGVAIVDFYLPEGKIVIQCDGCYWHGCIIHRPVDGIKRDKKDKENNEVLESNGFKVHRFWEHEINESPEKCIDKVEQLSKLLSRD